MKGGRDEGRERGEGQRERWRARGREGQRKDLGGERDASRGGHGQLERRQQLCIRIFVFL